MSIEPWIEKYRPNNLNELVQSDDIKILFKNMIESNNCLHLLLHGKCGSGKTSIVQILARELYKDYVDEYVFELNASDDRGINAVRSKIISFSNRIVKYKSNDTQYPIFKLIILDEVDAMTIDAQNSLRVIIEETSNITRYCLICNEITNIIDAIQSRCAPVKFHAINISDMVKYLKNIINNEKFEMKNMHVELICELANGDLRQAIMNLQCVYYISRYQTITKKFIYEMYGYVDEHAEEYTNLLIDIKNGDLNKMTQLVKDIYETGYNIQNFCNMILKLIIKSDMTDIQKGQIILEIQDTIEHSINGGDGYLLLLNLFLTIKTKY
jgi:DNA polymerase III delta prime subunit